MHFVFLVLLLGHQSSGSQRGALSDLSCQKEGLWDLSLVSGPILVPGCHLDLTLSGLHQLTSY